MYNNLPEYCYAKNRLTGNIIKIKQGVSGYFPTEITGKTVDELNTEIGVTKGQAEAMYIGSMIGWDIPGANPANYDENGNYTAREKI